MPKGEPVAIVLKPFVERGKWRESTPNLRSVSDYTRVDGCAGKAAMVELYRRSVVVKKLLNDNGLNYPEDVEKLGTSLAFSACRIITTTRTRMSTEIGRQQGRALASSHGCP
jgi:hypothetical protein